MAGPLITGELWIFVAFDWGDEIHLDRARELVAASPLVLPRRRRTPTSFSYRPSPLHFSLEPTSLKLSELGKIDVHGGVTLFDIAAVSLSWRVPFSLEAEALLRLAGSLADTSVLVQAAKSALLPLHKQLLPAIVDPAWEDNLSEEYFVFQFPPEEIQLAERDNWIAGLVHLESGPLSNDEVAEALRLKISYSPNDLVVADWPATVLFDRDCDEALLAIEFANVQLLEFRHIDNRLDASLVAAGQYIHPLTRSWLPFWRNHSRPLRVLGELKVEATGLFERTGNALKLVGDPYLARLYRLVAARFHLETWQDSIERKLEVAEGVYQVVSDQASHFRTEFLEVIVVLLILIEIVLAFWH